MRLMATTVPASGKSGAPPRSSVIPLMATENSDGEATMSGIVDVAPQHTECGEVAIRRVVRVHMKAPGVAPGS